MAIISKNESISVPHEEYEGTYKRFIEYLKSLLSSKEKKTNTFFSSKSDDPEEQEAIIDGCIDIDNYYVEMNKILESDKNAADYLIDRLQQIEVEDGNKEVSKTEVKKILNDFLDKQANEESNHIFDIINNN